MRLVKQARGWRFGRKQEIWQNLNVSSCRKAETQFMLK